MYVYSGNSKNLKKEDKEENEMFYILFLVYMKTKDSIKKLWLWIKIGGGF